MAHLVDRTEDVPRAGDGSRVGDAPRTGGVPKVGEQGGCGSLIVVGTPIGNLSDFSPRGIEAFRDYRRQKAEGVEEPVFHKSCLSDDSGVTEWD